MGYDIKEAQDALVRLGARLLPDVEDEQAAADQLLKAFSMLKMPPIITCNWMPQYKMIEVAAGRTVRRVWFDGRSFKVSERIQEATTRNFELAISFDPLLGVFVGTQPDQTVVPTPGAKVVKRDALLVLVEAIGAELLAANS